ncbi:MAG: hypothetical protein HQL70_11595 [Magnetococcales bacterium]|nr:hypothetical protein [Magnetococcales bacterium]
MTYPKPPRHLTLLADDDQLGILFITAILLAGPGIGQYMGWSNFFGSGGLISLLQFPMTISGLLIFWLSLKRLLTPGCRIVLRVNNGGITDFRLSQQPFKWQDIHSVSRLSGSLIERLPIILLEISPSRLATADKTLWYKVLHFALIRKNSHRLIIFCGSLDGETDKIIETIQDHLSNKQ